MHDAQKAVIDVYGTQVIPAALPGKSADDSLLDRYLDKDGHPRLTLDSGEKITLPVLGIHQLENAQIALAVAQRAGVEHDAAVRALAGLQLPEGRGDVREIGSLLVIDDSYNANPASMRAALAVLETAPGRTLAALGDMLELGEQAPALHAALAEPVEAAGVDRVYTVGASMRHLHDALAPAVRGAHVETAAELRPILAAELQPGDTLLIKGSLGIGMGRLVEALLAETAPAAG